MKNILILIIAFYSLSALSKGLRFEPLYSIETTRREYPSPAKQVTRTYIGARALYGAKAISGELELAQSSKTDNNLENGEEVTSVIRRAMLGIRSYPITSKYLGFFLRAGVRAKQETLEIDQAGNEEKRELPVYVDPYAGAGFTLGLADNFGINASATLVQNASADVESSEQYDIQYTLSATLKIGNR